ncbi:MAG: hypothetical protein MUO72_05730 [Bacteroidales bacterium]|nr:hypothetical protein [Bacteroidales bacterium]
MKKILILGLLLTIFACEKKSPDFEYSFRISRSSYLNNTWEDSLIYYYSNESKLLRVDKYYGPSIFTEYYVTYGSDNITSWNGIYYFDINHRIIKSTNLPNRIDYTYNGDLITYQKQSFYDFVTEENYFNYENSNLVKDSTVIHHQNDPNINVTVYNRTYTDTLSPEFLVDYSGLLEFPLKSKFFIRTAESVEHGFLYKYTYELYDNEVIQYSEFFDQFHNESVLIWTTRFKLEEN